MWHRLTRLWRAFAGAALPPPPSRAASLPPPLSADPTFQPVAGGEPAAGESGATPRGSTGPSRGLPGWPDVWGGWPWGGGILRGPGHDPSVRHIPGDVEVAGDLLITYVPRLRSIGDGLVVPGDLTIGGHDPRFGTLSYEQRRVPLRALPSGMVVGKTLALRNCFRLERLPDDLRVGGSLLIEDCDALVALPDPLVVRGSLTILGGQSLASLPSRLEVAGDLRLSGTRVAALPSGLTVGGSLVVEGRSRVASIPADLRVGGDVVLRHTPVASLPDGLVVRGTLRMPGSRRLARLPANLVVPGKLDLAGCTALAEVPPGLTVGHSLKLRGCRALRSLPAGLVVPHTLDLRGCTSLTDLPRRMRLGAALRAPVPPDAAAAARLGVSRSQFTPALRLADCPKLTELPDDLVLDGPIEVAGSGLRDLPASLGAARVLWRGVLVPPDVVFHPERLSPADVLRQPNAELRRVLIERVGMDRLLSGAGARTVDADTDPGGPRQLVHVRALDQRFLACRCPSTGRQYLLRVPPETPTCRHAAAWMAGFDDPERYQPRLET